eukprot:scaffold3791_cov137-Cylindrotheca_fusiformis.AAC.2
MSGKLAFSLKPKKNSKALSSSKSKKKAALDGFETVHEEEQKQEELVHPDVKGPLVIPVQKDSRESLQERARTKRDEQQKQEELSKEDQEAITALRNEASGESVAADSINGNINRVIQSQGNTFQNAEQREEDQLQEDLEKLAPDLTVDSETYQKVPIADFGAALLRGMGWTGAVDQSDTDNNLPRPSRLGLGATPQLFDVPTHKRGRRRPDQVKREKQLKEQQEEFEQKRQLQIKNDKQQTIQVGSIVSVKEGQRAIIRQWNGVPGLNMILVQFEGDDKPTKVKKGSVHLLDRQGLQNRPFEEPVSQQTEKKHSRHEPQDGSRKRKEEDERRGNRRRVDRDDTREHRHDSDIDRRRRNEKLDLDEEARGSRRSRVHGNDRDKRSKRDSDSFGRDETRPLEKGPGRKRTRYEAPEPRRSTTWLTPNIRVRVITSRFGRSHDKKKGIVVDVTSKGATLRMADGSILEVPERYLETALPKVGGNVILLSGKNRFEKGKLIERDSRANKGAVQLFEEMNIVNTSLDDIAEWCLSLDDDLIG